MLKGVPVLIDWNSGYEDEIDFPPKLAAAFQISGRSPGIKEVSSLKFFQCGYDAGAS